MPKYKGGEFVYVPTVIAPITMSYNLPGVDKLQLSPATISAIFQLEITKWNDPLIAADNPGVTLPDTDIVVARRADGSGTTENFSKFLNAAVGPDAGGDVEARRRAPSWSGPTAPRPATATAASPRSSPPPRVRSATSTSATPRPTT